jgi:hypothetical protein
VSIQFSVRHFFSSTALLYQGCASLHISDRQYNIL